MDERGELPEISESFLGKIILYIIFVLHRCKISVSFIAVNQIKFSRILLFQLFEFLDIRQPGLVKIAPAVPKP